MPYQLAQYSLRGGRPTNQDRIGVAERDNAVIMVVADGLGGHSGGELAAATLTDIVLRAFGSVKQPVITRPSAFLALTILQAHTAVHARGRTHIPPIEPRTTCVICLVQNGYAYWAHVGDSRLYHFRDNRLLTRTQDHTTVEQMHQDGLISDEEMGEHPSKGRLLKCVGGPNKPTISLGEETALQRGDTLLLCSDGLWEALSAEEIAGYVRTGVLEEGVEEMLLAVERKMKRESDNISVVCLRWDEAMTKALPLQGNAAMQVNPKQIWDDGTKLSAGVKRQQRATNAEAAEEPKGSLDSRIQELEEYLRRYEPK